MRPLTAARAAAPDGASDPRHADQAGRLIGQKATSVNAYIARQRGRQTCRVRRRDPDRHALKRHGKCFAFDSGGKQVGQFATLRGAGSSIPTDRSRSAHAR